MRTRKQLFHLVALPLTAMALGGCWGDTSLLTGPGTDFRQEREEPAERETVDPEPLDPCLASVEAPAQVPEYPEGCEPGDPSPI